VEASEVASNPIGPTTASATVEAFSWITKYLGGDGSGQRSIEVPLTTDSTVRSVLLAVTSKYPELHDALWMGKELGGHIEVMVNDAVLDVTHTLDSSIKPGDRIGLLGQFMGG
jgi:molybdopterin converting factor small subunit